MMMNKKGITPIISVILLLMMSVAVAGIAWFWLQSMTQRVTSQTEIGTQSQLTAMQGSLIVQSATCDVSAGSATIVAYNPGSTTTASSLVVGGGVVSTSTSLTGGAATAITIASGITGVSVGANTAILNTALGSTTFSLTCVA